jgi:hypothetical protein
MGYLILLLAWAIGVIVPFSTGHIVWGFIALLCPPVGLVIGGFWLLVAACGVLLALFA